MELSDFQIVGLLVLVVFGFAYNSMIGFLQQHGLGDFTALQVVVGTLIVLLVLWFTADQLACYTANTWLALMLLHFAAAGGPMIYGSYKRRG